MENNTNEVAGTKITETERSRFNLPTPNSTNDIALSSYSGENLSSPTPPTQDELSKFSLKRKAWRLADGTLTELGPGRPPQGSILVFSPEKTPKAPRKAKVPVMIRLQDGTVRARRMGRQPKGSVVVENETN